MAAHAELPRGEGVNLDAAQQINALGVVRRHLSVVGKDPALAQLTADGTGWALYLADAPAELTQRDLTQDQRRDLRNNQGQI
jgi:hypothetical protein